MSAALVQPLVWSNLCTCADDMLCWCAAPGIALRLASHTINKIEYFYSDMQSLPARVCAGIGVPAAAASGMMAANSLVGVFDHLGILNELAL